MVPIFYHWKTMLNELKAGHIRSFVRLPYVSSQLHTFSCARLENYHVVLCSMFKTIFPFTFCQDNRQIACCSHQATTIQHFSFQFPELAAMHMLWKTAAEKWRLDCSQSPIFPCDRRCTCGSLNASETGESAKYPWVGVVEGTAKGKNRETVNASLCLVLKGCGRNLASPLIKSIKEGRKGFQVHARAQSKHAIIKMHTSAESVLQSVHWKLMLRKIARTGNKICRKHLYLARKFARWPILIFCMHASFTMALQI